MFKGPGPGRPKGLQNKVTRDVQAFTARVLTACGGEDELAKQFLHSENEETRLKMFSILLYYRFGKPKETQDVHVMIHDELGPRVAMARKAIAETELVQ
jgi:hypothetical protein